ncbi:M23 family metallopeptidase [Chryseobacterium wangxinyae]|uniref:M23 family metallopeptidase n=1 Tax=Chryseobacterium sp. CY353 TaxID=2997334 RepID=UPI00227007A9|nr:M23 family metallopeptidase [Chryseobacterium sp. CY353]MCY0970401.1 M23 family metallopeptidase [Chryseobacterium sp. CY353]
MPSTAKDLLKKEITVEIVKNYFGQKYNKKTKKKEDWYLKRVKEFADMTAVKQLDYVKQYFEPLRGKSVEVVDFYLQVLFPASSLKDEHIVFASSLKKLTTRTSESEKLRNLRVNAYSQNRGLDVNNDGVVWKSEIKTKVQVYITEGLANKEKDFECGKKEDKPNTSEVSKCPEDCSQCVDYADVVSNPKVNNQSGDKNHNRYNKAPRTRSNGTKYYHTGTDILAVVGTEVCSMTCGEVIHIRKDLPQNDFVKGYENANSYGNTVTIKSKDASGNTVYIFYAHLSQVKVIVGQKVKHNDVIALSGSTGNAMHVEVKYRHVHVEAGKSYIIYGGTSGQLKCRLTERLNPEDYMKTKFNDNGN